MASREVHVQKIVSECTNGAVNATNIAAAATIAVIKLVLLELITEKNVPIVVIECVRV